MSGYDNEELRLHETRTSVYNSDNTMMFNEGIQSDLHLALLHLQILHDAKKNTRCRASIQDVDGAQTG